MAKREYKRLTVGGSSMTDGANEKVAQNYEQGEQLFATLGNEEWELVSVASGDRAQSYTMIFKRPKPGKKAVRSLR